MKIAFIVHDYNRSAGHSRYVAELASIYKRNHEVHVFANTWEEPNPEGLFFHKVPALTSRELLKVLSFILPATWIIQKNFDIVHSQGLCGLKHDLSTVHIVQSEWLKKNLKSKKGNSFGSLAWKLLVVPLEKFVFSRTCSKYLISVSEKVSRELVECYKITTPIKTIYHGTDLEVFNPKNKIKFKKEIREYLKIPQDIFLAIYVGNLAKGAATAIKALTKVPSINLMIVTNSNISKEKAIAKDYGLEERIHWVPKTNEISKYYLASDCLVYPSIYDTFGLVITEAMASGLPVITSKETGASELIVHSKNGLIIDTPQNADMIAHYLCYLKENPVVAKKISEEARNTIEKYTWEKCAKETMKVYLKIKSLKKSDKCAE